MRRALIGLALGLAWLNTPAGRAAESTTEFTIDLWPGPPPGEVGTVGEEEVTRKPEDSTIRRITKVTKPTLTVFRPEPSTSNGAAIVICPGGGYNLLAWDHEGLEVARWLNTLGITAAVLKYRVPRREGTPADQPPPQALMDAQRALSLVRSKATDWQIDPNRVGMLGFSAGGHLTASTATNSDRRAYEPADDVDRVGCRPDFAILLYPGGVIDKGTDKLSPQIRVSGDSPPIFFAHAGDDRVDAQNSIAMYQALKRAGVPAELHIYSSGGHGFGIRPSAHPASTWPDRAEHWMRESGILQTGFVPMFNGKNLDDWVQKGGKAKYRIEGNEIIGTTVPATPNSFLCTEKLYGNFILEVDFKVPDGMNSGIQIRSECFDEARTISIDGQSMTIPAGRVHGYQVEIDPSDRAWTGGIYDEGRRKWLDDLKDNESARKAFKHNDWNSFKIECRGDSIKTWINGVPAGDLKDSLTPKGFIALQVHGIGDRTDTLEVRWRDVRIKELK